VQERNSPSVSRKYSAVERNGSWQVGTVLTTSICVNWTRGHHPMPNSWTKSRQKSSEFSSLLFTVTSTALPWDFYFFKLTQPLTVSVKVKGGKPDRTKYPPPYGLKNTYRNLKSENPQDYAQKPQWNCTFMDLASGFYCSTVSCLCLKLLKRNYSRKAMLSVEISSNR